MAENIIPVGGKMRTMVGKFVADASQIGTQSGQSVEDALKNGVPSSGVLTNTEDLEYDKSKRLQFADRKSSNGMAFKILRLSDGLSSVLAPDSLSEDNTIFEVRYDFDLNGQTLNIGSNCTLLAKGGSFANGTLVGNNTKIVNTNDSYLFRHSVRDGIITEKVDLSGKWATSEIKAEWFGAKGDSKTDDYNALTEALRIIKKKIGIYILQLESKTYVTNKKIEYNETDGGGFKSLQLLGRGIHNTVILFKDTKGLEFKEAVNLVLKNFTVRSFSSKQGTGLELGNKSEGKAVIRSYIENVYIDSCELGMYAYGWINTFVNLNVRFNTKGFDDECTQSTYINIISEGNDYGGSTIGYVFFGGGTIEGNKLGGLEVRGNAASLLGVYFEGNTPKDNDKTDLNHYGVQNRGYHIKAGAGDKYCQLVIMSCSFHNNAANAVNGRNTIELDKVSKCVLSASETNNLNILTTERTGAVVDDSETPIFQSMGGSNIASEYFAKSNNLNTIATEAMVDIYDFSKHVKINNVKEADTAYSETYSLSEANIIRLIYAKKGEKDEYTFTDKGIEIVATEQHPDSSTRHVVPIALFWDAIKDIKGKVTVEFDLEVKVSETRDLATLYSLSFFGKTEQQSNISFNIPGGNSNVTKYYFGGKKTFWITFDIDYVKTTLVQKLGEKRLLWGDVRITHTVLSKKSEISPDEDSKFKTIYSRVAFYEGNIKLDKRGPAKMLFEGGILNVNNILLPNEGENKPMKDAQRGYLYDSQYELGLKYFDRDEKVQKRIECEDSKRPVLTSEQAGITVYNRTKKKYMLWNGEKYTNLDGTDLA